MTPPLAPYIPRCAALSLDEERRYAYLERLGMICDGGPVTQEAHEIAWEQVTGVNL